MLPGANVMRPQTCRYKEASSDRQAALGGRTEEGLHEGAAFGHLIGPESLPLEHRARNQDDEEHSGDDAADELCNDVGDGLHWRRDPGGTHGSRDRGVQVPPCMKPRLAGRYR